MSKTIINSEQAPKPIGPYSQAILAGNTLYVSGQIALDAQTEALVDDNITVETEKVMENIGHILQAAGFGYEHVVKCSIFVKDLYDFSAINDAYGKYFKSNPPARETVEVSQLPKDVNVEISCIAVK